MNSFSLYWMLRRVKFSALIPLRDESLAWYLLLLSSFLYYLSFTYFHHRAIRNALLLFFFSLDNKTDIFNWSHPIFKPHLITSRCKNPIPVNSHLTSGIFYCPLNFFMHRINSVILCPLNKTNKCPKYTQTLTYIHKSFQCYLFFLYR